MTESDYQAGLLKFFDKYENIKPRASFNDTGNGLSYNAMDVMFRDINGFTQNSFEISQIQACMPIKGLLYRTPDNTYGQQSFDDYLRVAKTCIVLGNKSVPRQILWYAIKHAFFMTTDPTAKLGDRFLGRFIFMWMFMWIAAFPVLKWVFWPVLTLFSKLQVPDVDDSSGTQLQMSYLYAYGKVYKNMDIFNNWWNAFGSNMNETFNTYYDPDHPFCTIVAQNKLTK